MKMTYDYKLIKELSLFSTSIEKINKSFRLYVTKLAYNLGIKPIESQSKIPQIRISALAYFILLIKGVKAQYSYDDLYMHLLLTQPNITDHNDMLNLICLFYSIPTPSNTITQSYFELFNKNQVKHLNLKHNLNDAIDRAKLFNTISALFASEMEEDSNIIITIDYLLSELRIICDYFNNLTKLMTLITKKGLSNSIGLIAIVFTPSVYTRKIGQYSNAVQTCCSNVYQSFTPKQTIIKCYNTNRDIIKRLGNIDYYTLPKRIVSNCYYPFENTSVMIKDNSIKLSAHIRNSSVLIKDKISNCITSEATRLKNCYGRRSTSLNTTSDEINLEVDSKVVTLDRNWLYAIIDAINSNFLYVKAKDIIDNCYMKWLINDKASLSTDNKSNCQVMKKRSSKSAYCIQRHSYSYFAISTESKVLRNSLVLGKEEESQMVLLSEVSNHDDDNGYNFSQGNDSMNNSLKMSLNELLENKEDERKKEKDAENTLIQLSILD